MKYKVEIKGFANKIYEADNIRDILNEIQIFTDIENITSITIEELNKILQEKIKILEERIDILKHTIEIDKITIRTQEDTIKIYYDHLNK